MSDLGGRGSRPSVRTLPGFGTWLAAELRARNVTQRALAMKAGVHHSTISRLMRGHVGPSLKTATRLVVALDPTTGSRSMGPASAATALSHAIARVEYALRSDDLLTEGDVRQVMSRYLALRSAPPRSVRNNEKATSARPLRVTHRRSA